jgi:spore germination protein YaaH
MLKKLLIIIISIVGAMGAIFGLFTLLPGQEEVDPLTYFSEFRQGQINLVLEDTRIDMREPIIELEEEIYLSDMFLKEHVDDRIFYDAKEQILTITRIEEILRWEIDQSYAVINGQEKDMEVPLILHNERAYLPATFIMERYPFSIQKGKDERLYIASHLTKEKPLASVKTRKSVLRTHPDAKSIITDHMTKDHIVEVYKVENGFARVRNENGIIGYIDEKHIEIIGSSETKEPHVSIAKPVSNPLDGKVKLVWDQLSVATQGDWNSNKYKNIKGANVISPTWFEFADEEGNLIDRGTRGYVENAHQRGLQVWALMSHNFSNGPLTREILTSTAKRQYVIDQLLDASDRYGFDGINIDIENVQVDFSEEWVQFMRELYPRANEKGLTVSVDIYVPSAWSMHYEREKVSEVVDYFMVMAYDQHWSGSEMAGSVAALDWTQASIVANLIEVPKEKLVLGIPFYTRVWEEKEDSLSSAAYSMFQVQNTLNSWGVEPTYDALAGQYYVEKQIENSLKRMWIEDRTSMSNRVALIKEYDLAGFAAWRLGLETSDIWEVLNQID